jgi:hypothetical protein
MSVPRLAAATARRDVRVLGLVVAVELLVLALYGLAAPGQVARPRYALYPFVWINAGAWAILHADPPEAPRRHRLFAAAAAGVYLVALLWLAGLIGVDLAGYPDAIHGVTVASGSPGWERISLVLPTVQLTLIPFRVVGYLALSYLVYVTVLDAAGAALSGALGLVSCVSCAFPVLVSLSSGALGGSSAVVGAIFAYSTDLSTGVFLVALALLYYRPTFAGTAGQRME